MRFVGKCVVVTFPRPSTLLLFRSSQYLSSSSSSSSLSLSLSLYLSISLPLSLSLSLSLSVSSHYLVLSIAAVSKRGTHMYPPGYAYVPLGVRQRFSRGTRRIIVESKNYGVLCATGVRALHYRRRLQGRDFKETTSLRAVRVRYGDIFRNVSKYVIPGELSYRTMFARMRGWCTRHANRFIL